VKNISKAALSGLPVVSLVIGLSSCSVPYGSHYDADEVCGTRLASDGGIEEEVVIRHHAVDTYTFLSLESNHGHEEYRSERYFLRKGSQYISLSFLNTIEPLFDGDSKEVVDIVPVLQTKLWVAIREEHLDTYYADYSVVVFERDVICYRKPFKRVKRICDNPQFQDDNRTLRIIPEQGILILDVASGCVLNENGNMERPPNQPPLQTPVSGTPAASASAEPTADKGAPVAPPPSIAGR